MIILDYYKQNYCHHILIELSNLYAIFLSIITKITNTIN
jgi:hypothetical protein